MLTEGRIIIPGSDNEFSTQPERDTLEYVRHELLQAFGGYTEFRGCGAWKDGHGEIISEPVIVFDVAYRTGRKNLIKIAEHVKETLQQEAIYVRFNDGSVELI